MLKYIYKHYYLSEPPTTLHILVIDIPMPLSLWSPNKTLSLISPNQSFIFKSPTNLILIMSLTKQSINYKLLKLKIHLNQPLSTLHILKLLYLWCYDVLIKVHIQIVHQPNSHCLYLKIHKLQTTKAEKIKGHQLWLLKLSIKILSSYPNKNMLYEVVS